MIDRLEWIYKEVLGTELCNWSCLLNDFYKEAVPNPHLHIHVRPRYKNTVVINNHAYIDTEFAHHYALKKESVLLDDDRKILYYSKIAPKTQCSCPERAGQLRRFSINLNL